MILIKGLYSFALSCFFCLIASITFYSTAPLFEFILLPACTVTAAMLNAALEKRGKIALVPLLIAYIPLYFASKDPDGIFFSLVPAVFLTVTTVKGFRPEHNKFASFFIGALAASVFLTLISLIFDAGNVKIPFLYLFAASGTALTRTLRLPASEHDFRFQKNNVLSLLGAAVGMSVISASVIWKTIGRIVLWFYRHVVLFLIFWLANLLAIAVNLLFKVPGWLFAGKEFVFEFPDIETEYLSGEAIDSGEAYIFYDFKYAALLRNTLIVLFLIAMTAYIIYRVKNMKPKAQYDTGKVEIIREPVKKKEKISGNRGSIRRTYQKYLDYLRRNGVKREEGSTSAEMLERGVAANVTERAESSDLREYYLKARYDMRTEPDTNAVKASKDLFHRISRKKS